MGARSILEPLPEAPFSQKKRRRRRQGSPTKSDRAIVEAVVANTPGGLQPSDVTALAKVMRRSPDSIRSLIDDAREKFLGSASRYVSIHMEAVEAALADGSAAALEQAIRGSQWAIENLSAEGARVVEKPDKGGNQGIKIAIGVKVGGANTPTPAVMADVDHE